MISRFENTSNPRVRKKRVGNDIQLLWTLFLSHKRLFAASVSICLFCAVLFIYFSHPSYSVTGKLMLLERNRNASSASASLSALQSQLPMGLGSSLLSRSSTVENEKVVLSTKLLARDAVRELDLQTEYYRYKWFRSRLIYEDRPLTVKASPQMLQMMDDNLPMITYQINLTIEKSSDGYYVEGKFRKNKKKKKIEGQTFRTLPATIKTPIGILTLREEKLETEEQKKLYGKDYTLKVTIVPPMLKAKSFVKKTEIASASKKATRTLVINMKDENIMRGIDYINSLVAHYNQRQNDDKHEEVAKNDSFVSERLAKIDAELGLKDADWENYKTQFQVTEPKVDAEEVMLKKGSYESQIVNLGIQRQLLDYLGEYVNTPANLYELIPANVGVYSGDAVPMISHHNSMVTERKLLLQGSSEKSPQVKQLTQLIADLHPSIQTALERDKRSLDMKYKTMEREYNKYMARVSSVPRQERALTEVGRQRSVKQGVYMMLLQKREENAMELQNMTDMAKLIDQTQFNKKVRPRTKVILLVALFLGFVIPYLIIFFRIMKKKTIGATSELSGLTEIPVIGTVPSGCGLEDEALLKLRSSLLHQMTEGQKVLLVASHEQSAGKTFIAVRLADSLSQTGRKVVICDLNLRNPSVAKAKNLPQGKGLSDLLLQNPLSREDVLSAVTSTSDADILSAGTTKAVHPANLLAHSQLNQVLAILKETYDIVILDTPAVGEYSDILIDGLADMTCFVCCANQTKKSALQNLQQLTEEKRLPIPYIVLNCPV